MNVMSSAISSSLYVVGSNSIDKWTSITVIVLLPNSISYTQYGLLLPLANVFCSTFLITNLENPKVAEPFPPILLGYLNFNKSALGYSAPLSTYVAYSWALKTSASILPTVLLSKAIFSGASADVGLVVPSLNIPTFQVITLRHSFPEAAPISFKSFRPKSYFFNTK